MADEASTFVLEDVVAKEPTAITAEEKTFLEQNKDQLTAAEATKFGFDPALPKPPEVTPPPKPAEGEGGDGGEVIDDDITKAVSKVVAPLQQTIAEQQRTLDINTFLGQHPELGAYKNTITEFAKHPNYSALSISEISRLVTAADAEKLGARKERAAAAAAAASQTGADNNHRPQDNQPKDWRTAPADDYWSKRAEVMGQPGR